MPRFALLFLGAFLITTSCSKAPAHEQAAAVEETTPLPPGVPPETILFQAKNGNVTFTHLKHITRVDGKCETCHTKLFPQSRQPLGYKKANHRVSEATYTSCGFCHAVGATSFAADSNCQKCHVKKYE
jgi:c(7)-type cytochrome triheme protein